MNTLVRGCLLMGVFAVAPIAGAVAEPDHTVTAGRGLKAVYVGQDVDAAARSLGPPKESLYGFIYLHDLPDGTRLSYRVSDRRIDSVSVSGGSLSNYRTARGGKFGMTRRQIEELYGPPDAEAANKIFYHQLGIGFFFIAGSVSEISVFAPR